MSTARPKIAAVATTYFKYSHAQHIVDRFLEGYGWNGTHHHPPMDLVSLYVDQVGDRPEQGTLWAIGPKSVKPSPGAHTGKQAGRRRSCWSANTAAIRAPKGQTKYPRYEFFEQIRKSFATVASRSPCSATASFVELSGRGRWPTLRAS